MKTGNGRKALHLIYEYGYGFTVLTKSARILRDLDFLQKINEKTYGNRYIVESPDSGRLILETCMKDYFITRMNL